MNIRADFVEPLALAPEWEIERPKARASILPGIWRTPLRALSIRRLALGGRIGDAGRLPRYFILLLLGLPAIWAPILAYVTLTPPSYTSDVSLILPGAGSASSINLSEIGQASSSASSPYSSSALSPTVTYKRLLASPRVLNAAADAAGESSDGYPEPRVKLVDQTGLVLFGLAGPSPEIAKRRAEALTAAFLSSLETLRNDEISKREHASQAAIREYEAAVSGIRQRITTLQRDTGLSSAAQFNEIISDKEKLAIELRSVEARLESGASQMASLRRVLGIDPSTAALSLRLHADPEFQALANAMSDAGAELAQARGEFGEKHPVLIAARDDYAGARARMTARATALTGLSGDALSAQVDLSTEGERAALLAELVRLSAVQDGLAAERSVLAAAHARAEARVLTLTEAAAALDDLERDYQVAEAVFASALARVDTSKADLYASYPLVQVLENAALPNAPSSPHTLISLVAGSAASVCLVIALLLAWLRGPIIGWAMSAVVAARTTDDGPRQAQAA
ncbi:MAG: hypothetical protein AAGA95_16385 [Pseudomonadota bacterium]